MSKQAIIPAGTNPRLPPLPSGWCWVQLSDLPAFEANAITDGPFGSKLKTEHYAASGPRVIRLQNIGDGIFHDAMAHISEEHFESLRKHQVFPGDIVIGALGVELPRSCMIPDWLGPAIVKADCIRFKPHPAVVSPAYLNYALISDGTRSRTNTIIHGVGRPRLNLSEIKSIEIPLAPPNEQRRIVAKIEELFSDLDAGVAALERIRAKLKRYRAAVLKAAVEGKLTADWRAKHLNGEHAADLLRRILAVRRRKWEDAQLAKFAEAGKEPPKGWREKYQEPAGPDEGTLPPLPQGWCWTNVDQLMTYLRNGYFQSPSGATEGTPILRINAVRPMSVDLSEVRFLDAVDQDIGGYFVQDGDLLFTRYNGSVELLGVAGMVRRCQEKILHPDKLIRVKLAIEQPLPTFVEIAANVGASRKHMIGRARTTAGQTGISGVDIREMPIPLAPLKEQDQIVADVHERLSLIERAESLIGANLKRSARLRQSILKRAFEGKLVPQIATDEPASALLERICRQREQTAESPAGANGRAPTTKRKDSREGFFRRGAVVTYIVKRLSSDPSFGRTKLEKILHLTQTHLSFSLDLEFKRHAAGPFDEVIYKLEGVAKKNGWFETRSRPTFGVTYHPGPKADDLSQRAVTYLGETQSALDQLLDHLAKMNTDQAELLATTYAAWNDLLIDARPADEDAIIAEVYGWDESKAKFPRPQIIKCVAWMKTQGYVPTGQGQRTTVLEKKSNLRSKRKPKPS